MDLPPHPPHPRLLAPRDQSLCLLRNHPTASNRSRNHPSPLNPPSQYLNLRPYLPSLQSQQHLPSLLYKLKLPQRLRPPPILYLRPPPRLQVQLHRRHQNRRHLQTRVLQALQQVQPAVPVSAGSSTTSTLGAPLARASLAMSTWLERRRASTLLLSRFSSSPSCKRRRYRKLQTKPFVSLMSLVVGRAPASPRDRDPVPSSPPKYSSAVWLFLR